LVGTIPIPLLIPDHSLLVILAVPCLFDGMLYELIGAFLALMSTNRSFLSISWITLSCMQRIRSCFDVVKGLFENSLYYGFLRYPLAVFRVSVIIMLKHDNNSLCFDFTCSFIRQCGLVYLAFYERGTLVFLWYLGSCICFYQYFRKSLSPSSSYPHFWAGVPVG